MKKVLLLFVALFVSANAALADSGTLLGLRLGYYTEIEEPALGVEFLTGVAPSVDFNPNLEYVFVDHLTYLTINIDAHYDFYEKTGSFVYIGGGLGISYVDPEGPIESETDAGINLLFGAGINRKPVIPYVQAKAVLGDNDEFVLCVGIRF